MTPPIHDIHRYTTEMHKSLFDKLFFANLIDTDLIVDYGCADGALIRSHHLMFPSTKLIGYDNDSAMIETARDKTQQVNTDFSWNWPRVQAQVRGAFRPALLLSSVLHEVYSYLSVAELSAFESTCWQSGFEYVIIRDMMHSEDMNGPSLSEDVARVWQRLPLWMLEAWEDKWGTIEHKTSLVHLLLTYRYVENWDRELLENYLAVGVKTYLSNIPSAYEPIHFRHYTLPFLKHQVKQDFGIDLQARTHVQLILRRKS